MRLDLCFILKSLKENFFNINIVLQINIFLQSKTVMQTKGMDTTSKVLSLFKEFWNWRLKNNPEFATFCGFHDYDDRLESYTYEDIHQRQLAAQKFLDEAEILSSVPDFKVKVKENLKFFIADLNIYLKGFTVKGYFFPLSYFDGPHLEFVRLISAMKYETLEDYEKLLSRFIALPIQISQMIEMMRAGMKDDLVFHSSSVATIPDQLNQLDQLEVLAKRPEECVFYKPFINLPESISEDQKNDLLHKAIDSISHNVLPAFKALKTFLEMEYFKKARLQPGISNIPGGYKYYQLCLDFHLGLYLSPKEVHEMGLLEVKRISEEIKKVIESLSDKKMSIKEFTEYMRNEEKYYFDKPEDLLEAYKDLVFNHINPKIPMFFKNIPESEVVIEPFPPAMSDGPMAYYLAGTPDGRRPGVFYVNTKDVKSAPKYQMIALALHEAVPGHHLQQAYMYAAKDSPDFRKYIEDRKYTEAPSRFPLHTAYIEGWGLYCEYLGNDLELYENKSDYFGYLSQEIFRAARLVVDTGLHALGWSQDQAIAYMMENTASSKREIENEVRRYITIPGQACAYKIGEMKIKALRKMAERKLGTKFNIQDFHEVVLNYFGPLDVLEEKVLEFIELNSKEY